MANPIYLKDGRMEVITGDPRDYLSRLLYEELGKDVAGLFDDLTTPDVFGDDWEVVSEHWMRLCQDSMEVFGEIIRLIDAPRINKKRLREKAMHGYETLNNNL